MPRLSHTSQNGRHNDNYHGRQRQVKRQREWVYLCHYLAIEGLEPVHIISGADDGKEPDFTLVFYREDRLIYVGVELTTLPRLREQMGETGLIAKRWYWQGLQLVAKARHQVLLIKSLPQGSHPCKRQYDDYPYHGFLYGDYARLSRFQLPILTLYMPTSHFAKHHKALPISTITQADVDAVMHKKTHKIDAYHTRRPLHELWLLVHTDKYQPDCILMADGQRLYHNSGFDQVHITRYPSHKVLKVVKN